MYFIDTSAWIAWVSTTDDFHTAIKNIIDKLLKNHVQLFTSNYVFCETITRLNTYADWYKTKQFLGLYNQTLNSKIIRNFWIDKNLEAESLVFLDKYADHRFSLTDATIAVLVKKHNIKTIITTDEGFSKIGFNVLP